MPSDAELLETVKKMIKKEEDRKEKAVSDPKKDFMCPKGHVVNDSQRPHGKDSECQVCEKEKHDWHTKYKQVIIDAGVDEAFAQQCLDAVMPDIDYDDDPEDAARDEMSYWAE